MFTPPRIDVEAAQSACSTPEPSPGCTTGETIKSFFSDPPSPRQSQQQSTQSQAQHQKTTESQSDSIFLRYLYEQKPPQNEKPAPPAMGFWGPQATQPALNQQNLQPFAKSYKPATLSDRFGVLEDGLLNPNRSPIWKSGEGMKIAGIPQLQPAQQSYGYGAHWQTVQQQQSTPGLSALLQMLVQTDAHQEPAEVPQPHFVGGHTEHAQASLPTANAQRPSPLELALAMAHLTDAPKTKKREKGVTPPVHTVEDLAAHEAMGEEILAAFTRLAAIDHQAAMSPSGTGTPFALYQQLQPQRYGHGHDTSSRPVCLDHLKGTCHKARKSCKFAHPPLNNGLPYAGDIGIPRVCEVWACTGFCKFGNKCKYEHPPLMGELQYTPAVTKKMLEFALTRAGPGEA